jgi:Transmembrane protein 43
MFETAQTENVVLTWVVRALGLVFMFIGFKLAFSLLDAIAKYIPGLGGLVSAGTSLIAFAFTALIGSLAIAAGWIVYRPILGIGILLVGVLAAAAASYAGRGKKAVAV